MRQSESRSGIGSFVGFLIGVGVGVLFATKPGSETRRQLSDLINKSKQKGGELLKRGGEQIERSKEAMASEGGKEPYFESGKYT